MKQVRPLSMLEACATCPLCLIFVLLVHNEIFPQYFVVVVVVVVVVVFRFGGGTFFFKLIHLPMLELPLSE